jgi:hypothetical protein
MALDHDRLDDAVLALLYLTLHDGSRAWKGFDWDTLNRLHAKGMIDDPRSKAKSVVLTPEGLRQSKALFERMFVKLEQDSAAGSGAAESARSRKKKSGTGKRDIYTFRVSLKPKIFRELEIFRSKTLYDLAASIVDAFDFDLDHAFGFYDKLTGNYVDSSVRYELFADIGESKGPGVRRVRIDDAFQQVGAKMKFLFDYGDEWHFSVEVIGENERKPGVKYPRIVKTTGKAPLQYDYPEDE